MDAMVDYIRVCEEAVRAQAGPPSRSGSGGSTSARKAPLTPQLDPGRPGLARKPVTGWCSGSLPTTACWEKRPGTVPIFAPAKMGLSPSPQRDSPVFADTKTGTVPRWASTAGSSIRWTAPPTTFIACRTTPSRLDWSATASSMSDSLRSTRAATSASRPAWAAGRISTAGRSAQAAWSASATHWRSATHRPT